MFSDLENIAVESIRTYSPFSVSFFITRMLDPQEGKKACLRIKGHALIHYPAKICFFIWLMDFKGSGCIFLNIAYGMIRSHIVG